MLHETVLWTCSGGMKIIYLKQFAKMIAHNVVQQPYVDVAHGEQPKAFWDPVANSEFSLPPMETSFRRETYKLEPFHQITEMDKVADPNRRGGFVHMFREIVTEKALARIEEELKIMIAKRQPTFFMKDLSMENVEKLSEEYAKQMGNDACGIQVQLSPYQKFFVIADASDFVFYLCHVEKHRIDLSEPVTEIMGKLVDLQSDKWQMGRYENLTFLNELNAMRYVHGSGK